MLINLRSLTQNAHLNLTFAAVPEEEKKKKKESPAWRGGSRDLPYLEYRYEFGFVLFEFAMGSHRVNHNTKLIFAGQQYERRRLLLRDLKRFSFFFLQD